MLTARRYTLPASKQPLHLQVPSHQSLAPTGPKRPNPLSHSLRHRPDPYFRLTRDIASQLKYAKPSLLHARFPDALQGPGSETSGSDESSAIFLKDNPGQILKKINQHAFRGGQETLEEHRAKGGDTEVDVSYQYLKFFLEVRFRA